VSRKDRCSNNILLSFLKWRVLERIYLIPYMQLLDCLIFELYLSHLCDCRVLGIRVAMVLRKAKYRIVELDGLTVKEMAKKRAHAHNKKQLPKAIHFPAHCSPPSTVVYSTSHRVGNHSGT